MVKVSMTINFLCTIRSKKYLQIVLLTVSPHTHLLSSLTLAYMLKNIQFLNFYSKASNHWEANLSLSETKFDQTVNQIPSRAKHQALIIHNGYNTNDEITSPIIQQVNYVKFKLLDSDDLIEIVWHYWRTAKQFRSEFSISTNLLKHAHCNFSRKHFTVKSDHKLVKRRLNSMELRFRGFI